MLLKTDLKKYDLPKTYIRNGKECFLDPIREKLIIKTPEEIIRQKIIKFLQDKIKVPKGKIELEIPMSYYKKRARGRADIIVSAYTEDNKFVPVLIVECKAPNVHLTDEVFKQVRKYDEIIYADTVAITNGNYFIIKSWDYEKEIYRSLDKLPTYKDLIDKKNLVFDTSEYKPWKRPDFNKINNDEVVEEFINNGWLSENSSDMLRPFFINLAGCIQNENNKLSSQKINEISLIEDGGIRFTSFSNASGGSWTGLYRYFIIEDKSKNNQIISISIMAGGYSKSPKTVLVVAIDDYKKSHNSLQLNLDKYTSVSENNYKIWHSGALTVGNSGRVRNKEVVNFIKSKSPNLVKNNKIFLGSFDNKKEIKINQSRTKKFLGRLMEYALLRDEFREIKRRE
ncbi:hypothetical protein JCM16358_08350 [Halanaerocella petrolearia]